MRVMRLINWMRFILVLACLGGTVLGQGRFEGYAAGQSRTVEGAKMVLRWCPPGEFVMGSPEDEPGRDAYEIQHHVRLTKGFWLGETEVTQEQWTTVTGKSLRHQAELMLADDRLYPVNGKQVTLRDAYNSGHGSDVSTVCAANAPNIPIYYVSWDDAM